MKRYTSLAEFTEDCKKSDLVAGDDFVGIIVPTGLTDEEFVEYIALFNAGHRRKVSCRKERA